MDVYIEIRKKLGAFNLDIKFDAEKDIVGLLGASGSRKV